MPLNLHIDPDRTRVGSVLRQPVIPVHAYQAELSDERHRVGDAALVAMLRDMIFIREFETLLGALKAQSRYRGFEHTYSGPAHLSVGQEAAAVGTAFSLTPQDHVFGSHRSHGEFIAKGFSAIRQIDRSRLLETMEGFAGGGLLAALEKSVDAGDVVNRAEQFMFAGLLAELFGRSTGFNAGMGGSMHAFFPEWGIYPNNAIVGGSAGIAAGSALHKKLRGSGGIAVANIGDGATGCGPVWEAMNFAAMGQYDRLWDEDHRGGLPVAFVFHNNFYAMGGQTIGETSGYERLSRIGSAFNADGLHAETVDGNDPLAVLDAMTRKRELLTSGRGPVLLDLECYRAVGHSTTDGNTYRSKEELAAWRHLDPITLFTGRLVDAGVVEASRAESLAAEATSLILAVARVAADPDLSPRHDVRARPVLIGHLMFAGSARELPAAPHSDVLAEPGTVPRVRQLATRSRSGHDAEGRVLAGRAAVTIRDALFETVLHHSLHDPELVIYGEECREWGGAFGVYKGLAAILPYHRLFNAPISEAAIVATAVGYAMEGGRALVELMYADFIGRAGDELFNQLAKWRAMSGGLLTVPVVVRTSVGSKYGAQHSQDWTGLVAHIPGLQVVYPATPYDAKGLLATAMSSDDPTVFFESQRLYETTELFHPGGVPDGYYRIPLGQPDLKRPGRDLTLLTVGPSLYQAVAAAETLSRDFGVEAEIIDARSLVPFDYDLVLESVQRTGRIALVSEATERGGILATMAQVIAVEAAADLRAPVQVLGAPNWIVPSGELEKTYFPQADDIVDLIHDTLVPLPGWNPTGLRQQNRAHLSRRGL